VILNATRFSRHSGQPGSKSGVARSGIQGIFVACSVNVLLDACFHGHDGKQ
jgi:hypothetical protein